jgi:hypothetical protein
MLFLFLSSRFQLYITIAGYYVPDKFRTVLSQPVFPQTAHFHFSIHQVYGFKVTQTTAL